MKVFLLQQIIEPFNINRRYKNISNTSPFSKKKKGIFRTLHDNLYFFACKKCDDNEFDKLSEKKNKRDNLLLLYESTRGWPGLRPGFLFKF